MSHPNKSQRSRLDNYLSFPVIARQNPWLDFLRSLAIILVLMRHGEKAVPQDTAGIGIFLHNIFTNGWLGVDLFLVLSGYLISKSLIKYQSTDGFIRIMHYFKSRAYRIIPAYYATLLIVAFGFVPFYVPPADVTATSIFYHLLFLQDYLPSQINVVFWSLGVEEKFYILAPLLILLITSLKKWQWGALILVGLLSISPISKLITFYGFSGDMTYQVFFETLRSPFHQTLESLLVGVMVGFIAHRTSFKLSTRHALFGLWTSALLAVLWLSSSDFYTEFSLVDLTVQPLGFSALFGVMVFCSVQLQDVPLRGNAIWRPIARLSYSLYLVHFPMIPISLVLASQSSLPWLTFWVFFLTISFLAALLLHFTVEKPFLFLKTKNSKQAGSATDLKTSLPSN